MDTMEFEDFTICFFKLYRLPLLLDPKSAEAEKSAVRKITSSEYLDLDHRKPLIRRLSILTVCSLYILPSILYIMDNQSGYSTIYCRDQIHSYNTREGASWTMDISRCHLYYCNFITIRCLSSDVELTHKVDNMVIIGYRWYIYTYLFNEVRVYAVGPQ